MQSQFRSYILTSIDKVPAGCAHAVGSSGTPTGPLPTKNLQEALHKHVPLYKHVYLYVCVDAHAPIQNSYGILGWEGKLGHLRGLHFTV